MSGEATRLLPPIGVPGFVGRELELAKLERALAGPPAVVLIEGEAGIGKSRLLREFLGPDGEVGRAALLAVCPPFRESLTLGPVVDAILQARDRAAGLRLSALGGALRPLFPEWAADLPPAPEPLNDARAARHRLFRALAELIASLGTAVLIVEDAHWADDATLEFLLFLTARPGPSPSLVVTYRPENLPADSLLLRLSARPPGGGAAQTRIVLGPLDVAGTAGLVSSMLDGEHVSEAFAEFLHRHTDGVPLAIEESVRLLGDRANLVRRDGAWVRLSLEDLRVPPTVRDAVLERVQRLGEQAQAVLAAAAVLAEPAGEALLTEIAGLTSEEADAGLAEAVGAGLLGEHRWRVSYRHALMGRAVYESLPGPHRRRLHLRAAQALEAAPSPSVVALARHFREADATAKWCEYAERAAQRAVESGDHASAMVMLNNLLTVAELSPQVRARLARQLAATAVTRRDALDRLDGQVLQTLRSVLDDTELDPRDEAEIRALLGRLLMQLSQFAAARVELERAVPNLDHNPVAAARAMTYLGYSLPTARPAEWHLHWLRGAAQAEARITDPLDRMMIAIDRAVAMLMVGEPAGWQVVADLPARTSSAEANCELARGYSNLGYVALIWGRYAEADHWLASATELADAVQYLRSRSGASATQVHLDWLTGRWDAAAAGIAAYREQDEFDSSPRLGIDLAEGLLLAARGAYRRAEALLRPVLDQSGPSSTITVPFATVSALGRVRLADGDARAALELTDAAMRELDVTGIWIWATDIARVRLDALILTGQLDEAQRLVSAFAAGLGDRDAPAPRAALTTCRAALAQGQGEHAQAAAAFGRAAAEWERLPCPYEAYLATERQGRCLLAAGRTERGLRVLDRAFRGLADLGARGDASRIMRELRDNGVDVRAPWRGGRRGYGDRLSPRELEVVRLVAAGHTNREVARTLSRSPWTVAGQLNSAMRKLGVSSRTALAMAAAEAGLLGDGEPPNQR